MQKVVIRSQAIQQGVGWEESPVKVLQGMSWQACYAAWFSKHDIVHCLRAYLCVISNVIMLQPCWGVYILQALISQASEPTTSRQALLLHTLLSSHVRDDKGTWRCLCSAAERLGEGGQGNRSGLLVTWCDVCQGCTSKRYTTSLLVLQHKTMLPTAISTMPSRSR